MNRTENTNCFDFYYDEQLMRTSDLAEIYKDVADELHRQMEYPDEVLSCTLSKKELKDLFIADKLSREADQASIFETYIVFNKSELPEGNSSIKCPYEGEKTYTAYFEFDKEKFYNDFKYKL